MGELNEAAEMVRNGFTGWLKLALDWMARRERKEEEMKLDKTEKTKELQGCVFKILYESFWGGQ